MGLIPHSGGAETLDVVGTLAYVGTFTGDLAVFDVGDPTHPVLLGKVNVVENAINDIQVVGSHAYPALGDPVTLSIVDVTTPSAPHAVGRHVEEDGIWDGFARVKVARTHAYLVYYHRGDNLLRVFDIRDPSAPEDVAPLLLFPGGGPTNVEVVPNRA